MSGSVSSIMPSEDAGAFSVAVRGRCMIAHSFKGELFGPAQALHGCTYVVDAVCKGARLQPDANYLVDICALESALHDALAGYDRSNLDDIAEFSGDNTTCERIARAVWERVAAALPGPPELESLQIIVRESDVAHVEYERALGPGSQPPGLYSVSVRGRFMAARTLASRMQGATFVVDALFSGPELDAAATFLFDICLAEKLVHDALEPLHQTCLDDHATMGRSTLSGGASSNAIAQAVWTAVASGLPTGHALTHLKIVVREHDQATAECSCPLLASPSANPTVALEAEKEAEKEAAHTLVARGRCMIAHSFQGEQFGPAQALHGCTYVVDARYGFRSLGSEGGVAVAHSHSQAESALRAACEHYHQTNLDELEEFAGENTTCERVARALWGRVTASLPAALRRALSGVQIVVKESDVAWVAFERGLGPPSNACGVAILFDLDSLEAEMEVRDLNARLSATPVNQPASSKHAHTLAHLALTVRTLSQF